MIERRFTQKIAAEQDLSVHQVDAVQLLLNEGATIPFIARYRKEATESLDEVAITGIRDRLQQLQELSNRRTAVLNSLEKHGHLTEDLQQKVLAAENLAALEDIYLPYRPKRRTRAVMAREKGLEPLATAIFEQSGLDPAAAAASFVDPEKGVETIEDALAGARDIIAEIINEHEGARAAMRQLFFTDAVIQSTVASGMEERGIKYKDYFDWSESVAKVPSHRFLAMLRGEREDVLNLNVFPDETTAVGILKDLFICGDGADSDQVMMAIGDGYKRLLSRSMETETRVYMKERADREAIRIFAENLRQLLLAPPLGAKRVLGIDPGFKTGCKVVCLDRQGKLLSHDTVFPHTSEKKSRKAAEIIKEMCRKYRVEAIAVGNGTAGRETENFLRNSALPAAIQVIMVNESGASIYSASKLAREEFPNLDLTVRGAISIGRRLMDPLAELVKIDPKSIGVGQYQHDVDPTALKQSLDDVVTSCVNAVGVDLNRASVQLLTYVSGLNAGIAKNIVSLRETNGPFAHRRQLLEVPRLGPKTFEQSAGFLRIPGAANPLDASAVHPESYPVVDAMAEDLGVSVADLIHKPDLRSRIDKKRYVSDSVGLPTLNDILAELAKPGRDPRNTFEAFSFAEGIEKIENLQPGMKLPGIVTNLTAFGAFVDIGVHQDGLVHISQLSDRFVKNPADILKVQQRVTVTVLDVDLARKRIALSLKKSAGAKTVETGKQEKRRPQPDRQKAKEKRSAKQQASFQSPLAQALIKSGLK